MHIQRISLSALLLCLVSSAVVALMVSAFAAVPPEAAYVGSDKCLMCHQGMHEKIAAGWKTTRHARSFADVTKNPESIRAEFSADTPFSKDQVRHVLSGSGKLQAYVGEDMKSLPGKWNVAEKKWQKAASSDAKTQCVHCHVTGYNVADASWIEPAVGCESCHGPGSAHSATGDESKIVNPKKLPADKRIMVCAQCHSHGTDPSKAHAFPVNFRPGDDLSKAFILAPVSGGQLNQQYNEFIISKHFTGGMQCTTCHEPHGSGATQPKQLVKAVNDLCVACHASVKGMKEHAPAAPAGATCSTCHMPGSSHAFGKVKN
jgi:predicted CXXCH cytochrome family protein